MSIVPISHDLPGPLEGEALTLLQNDLLPDYLLACRWYAAKDAGRPVVRIVDALPLRTGQGTAQLCLLRVEPPGREAQLYQIPLVLDRTAVPDDGTVEGGAGDRFRIAGAGAHPWTGALRDGYGEEAVARAMLDAIRTGHAPSAGLAGHRTRAGEATVGAIPADVTLERSGADQSNTSIRVGGQAILKALRKLEPGLHPELEVSRFLTETARFPNTPPLLGWVERTNSSGSTALCILQGLVPDCEDAWSRMTRRLCDRVTGFADTEDADDQESLTFLRRLGRRTAELHRALATPGGGEAFAPEPATAETLQGWAEGVRTLARKVLPQLREALPQLDGPTATYARSLAESEQTVMAQIDALTPYDATLSAMRLHGDLHLGQVLATADDVQIVDFEGEPMRPLAERRSKHCILRDVAGMLRSLAYVSATARTAIPEGLNETARSAREAWIAWWEGAACAAFVSGYREAIGDCPGFPREAEAASCLLKLFLLEKALYEIGYELANRPDRVAIPLAGVLGILAADAGPEVADPVAPQDERTSTHAMPFGAGVLPDGSVRFALWAPSVERVGLWLEGTETLLPMQRQADGWFALTTAQAQAGSRYRFELPDGLRVPDPASRFQPDDVHGPSEVIDPAVYRWSDAGWAGRPWEQTVLYELHIGTFTPEGSFRSAIERLDDLVELGVTAIELMPLADFPGARNWGYDGVLPFAPDSRYGRPEDFKALVDAAHQRGLMVFLDVVYNHFGPDGNYLHAYADAFFTDRHKTPWGSAINVDGPHNATVRDFFIHNALYWLEEFHLDGLRFDAVHAILDDGPKHFLEELSERVHERFGEDRSIHLVLENDANQARFLERAANGAPRWHTAQWNDDLHHALHSAASGEAGGYYADYADDPEGLARALAEGFAFQGHPSAYRDGERRGEPSAHLPPTAFVSFLQNHDQIGNRAFGERIHRIAPAEAVRAAACLYLLGPQIPMLFMGEEWGACSPFPFFCDFAGELAEAVRNGRREEFAKFPEFSDPKVRDSIPDPTAPASAESARLNWEERSAEPHAGWLDWYRRVLAVRHTEIVPRLAGVPGGASRHEAVGPTGVRVEWRLGDGSCLHLIANLAADPVAGLTEPPGRTLWAEGDGVQDGALAAWSVVWSLEEATALDRLGERIGIEREYGSATGQTVRASEETIRALLTAMGVDAADEEAAKRQLETLDREELSAVLPPVVVHRVDRKPFGVPVTLPTEAGVVRWDLITEESPSPPRGEGRGEGDTPTPPESVRQVRPPHPTLSPGGRGQTPGGDANFPDLPLLRTATLDGRTIETRRLDLGDAPPAGYYRLRVTSGETDAETSLIVVPDRCHLPAPIALGERLWGLSAQLYTLRSARDWGIGDFGDLTSLTDIAAARGAAVIGLNPLHALFLDEPEQASPYSPASRLFLNPLYIDVTAVADLLDCQEVYSRVASPEFTRALDAARSTRDVDYAAVAALKLPVLESLHEHFRTAAAPERHAAFDAFRAELGEALERFCTFQALRERFAAEGRPDWRRWPHDYRDAAGEAVRRFAADNRDRVTFFAWLQWIADRQLGSAATRAQALGMAIGFYRDLAVGADSAGAETWSNPQAVVGGAQVGAPPDLFNPAGQGWGLPPFHPRRLRQQAYRPFIELVRANMRHAGALRIDHAMALQHVYWIPEGRPPTEGAYVAYPMEDLLGILALESQRNRCLVVGEDLGTVPDGFRERMERVGILSYRVVFFEWREDDSLKGPDEYPALALATIGSHDLATLKGWWEGHDVALKTEKGLYPSEEEAEKQRARRRDDRARLIEALRAADLPLPASFGPDSPYDDALRHAAHAFLARTESVLAVVQIDDLTGEREQVNLPGTVDQYPNWRRKLSLTLEEFADATEPAAVAAVMAAARPAAKLSPLRGEGGRAAAG